MNRQFTHGPPSALTPRDGKVLAFLRRTVTDTFCPSCVEIEVACGFSSKSQVFNAIISLEAKGWIRRQPYALRAIALTDPFSDKPTEELRAMRDRIDRVLAERVA